MSTQWPGDFDALARQYWANWGNAMRSGASAAPAAAPTWQDAIQWWSQLAQGQSPDANSAVDRFNAQARDWYGQMQQVAAQFAGRDAAPADITAEWKRAMGGIGDNPFPDMFRAMQGQGAQGLEQWTAAIAPWLDAWRGESSGSSANMIAPSVRPATSMPTSATTPARPTQRPARRHPVARSDGSMRTAITVMINGTAAIRIAASGTIMASSNRSSRLISSCSVDSFRFAARASAVSFDANEPAPTAVTR